jgi:hypothetical protein
MLLDTGQTIDEFVDFEGLGSNLIEYKKITIEKLMTENSVTASNNFFKKKTCLRLR